MRFPNLRGRKCFTYDYPNGKKLRIYLGFNGKVTAVESEEGSVLISNERYDSLIRNATLGMVVENACEVHKKCYEQKN